MTIYLYLSKSYLVNPHLNLISNKYFFGCISIRKVIGLTANMQNENSKKKYDMDDIFTKPVNQELINKIISKYVYYEN